MIIVKEQTQASVATPATGKVAYFADSADGKFKYKDDAGVVHAVGGTGGSDAFVSFDQSVASASWSINHGLGKYPSVTVTDSSGNLVMGDVAYIDSNNLTVSFRAAFAGTAYMN